MAIEAIVRQKDKETTAANIAKLAGKVISFLKNKQSENSNLIWYFFLRKRIQWISIYN